MDILRHLLDPGYLYDQGGVDTVAYAFMAIIGSLLFAVRLSLSLLFGMDGDVDLDSDAIAHGTGFSFVSILSVIGFFMGAGWAGLASQLEWGLSTAVSALVAGGFGFFLMFLSSGLMFAATKLTHDVTYELKDAIGRTGTVYMTIPAKGEGSGQVRVSVSGRSMTVDAVSTGDKLDAFSDIKVTGVRDDKTLVVSAISE